METNMEMKCVPLRWDNTKKRNVCRYCGAETKSLYIATGHDHTDDRADLCGCGNGEDFRSFFARVRNATHPLSDYLPHLTPNA